METMKIESKKKLLNRAFTLVIIGQIISLFGNAALRFALPLYLLNQTGSSSIYGLVTACAMVPAILMSPVGGMIADRVNKRNIMVTLDFFTAILILGVICMMGKVNLVVLLVGTMMLLYGIAGAYQPSVQASIPTLVSQEHFMAANSVINMVSSLASLLGPVLGGILYSMIGIKPVLVLCSVCFMASAVMELFICIPSIPQPIPHEMTSGDSGCPSGISCEILNSDKGDFARIKNGILHTVKEDFKESVKFIAKEKPRMGKVLLVVCAINLFLSAMITVGLPYIVTEVLQFPGVLAYRLYGFSEGALAAGGLTGGICAGVFGTKLKIKDAGNLLLGCVVSVFPMGTVLILSGNDGLKYGVITLCCFAAMIFSTIFSVQILSLVQTETPEHLIGKVIAVILTVSMCAQPLGSGLYGILFEVGRGMEYVVVFAAGIVSLVIAINARKIFCQI